MVKRKTTRDFRVEEDDYIAVKRDEFTNGKGKHVVQIVEEHNISVAEIDDVINNLFQAELDNFDIERTKKEKEITDIKSEIADVVSTPEYIKFKEQMESEDTLKFMNVMSREKVLKASEGLLLDMDAQRLDIIAWVEQFKGLKSAVELKK
ncbi:MAG: hypothetical protein K0A90_00015 [Methanosarcinaceae archaeon]|nr:hypothetical protein [Methanosarcinaceae archaeon]